MVTNYPFYYVNARRGGSLSLPEKAQNSGEKELRMNVRGARERAICGK